MAAVVSYFRVLYHFEASGKKVGPHQEVAHVQAADGSYNSISSVLSSNGKTYPGGTLVIDNVINLGPGVSGVLA